MGPAGAGGRFWRWLRDAEFGRGAAQRDLLLQHAWDERGVRMHLAAALFLCFMLAFPTTAVEWAGLPVIIVWFLRMWKSWRAFWRLALTPQAAVLVAFLGWEFLTLLWTSDRDLGLKQVSLARWVWVPLLLWPVIEYRILLICAIGAGFLCANLGQVLHALGKAWDIPILVWDRMDDRNSAWWAPVVGGTMLTAALGLHIPAAFLGRGRVRLIGTLGAAVTFAGVLATGTRGAWIASAALLAVGALAGVWKARRRGFAVVVLVTLVGLGVGLTLVEGPVARRIALARAEVTAALRDGEFNSDTGTRIFMAVAAARAFAEHPVAGVGVGGYPGWVREYLAQQKAGAESPPVYVHAHNAYLHVAATTGLVGLGLALGLTVLVLRSAASAAKDAPGNPYALGPLFAIVGLILVSPFDTVHVNMQTTALLAALLGLCPAWTVGGEAAKGTGQEAQAAPDAGRSP